MSFVRGPNPIWFFSNLTGQPLDDTYYAFFLENTLPYNPQTVYQDPNGNIPWSDPIEFQPSSGLPNNLYFDPSKTYRIEVRQGPTQADPLIWLIQNYTVGDNTITPFSDPLVYASNMITNPQFADISFISPLTINTAGVHDIAPGWQIVTVGSGTTTITQNQIDGISDIFGNPPYSLTFNNSGWSSNVILRQRFTNNGAIYGDGAVAVAFTAYSTTLPNTLTVNYHPSVGSGQSIFTGSIPAGAPLHYERAITVDPSTNTDLGMSAYVDIEFVLPNSGVITLTNIQITGQSTPLSSGFIADPIPPFFQEQTYERTVDQEFHVYKNSLLLQPKENIAVGWTFALNPWQFNNPAGVTPTVNQYTADQTIVIQQNYVANNVGSNVSVARGTAAQNYALLVTAVTAANQFAIVQYIDPTSIRPYWNQILSSMVNVSATVKSPSPTTLPKFKMRLIYRSSLPPTVSRVEPIATWVTGSDPAFAAGWTAVLPLNDPTYTMDSLPDNFPFDQFQLPLSNNDNMTLGIVIYTITNINQTATADSILFNRVSLVPNDYAIDASPETYDQSLRKCKYYYEQSYVNPVDIGTATNNGLRHAVNPFITSTAGGILMFKNSFQLIFNEIKRSAPTLKFYSPDGTSNAPTGTVRLGMFNGSTYPAPAAGSNPSNQDINGNWTTTSLTTASALFIPSNTTQIIGYASSTTSTGSVQGEIQYHYTADARMGI